MGRPPLNEELIQRKIDDAMQGNCEEFDSLEEITRSRPKKLLRRTLAVASQHLKTGRPTVSHPLNPGRRPTDQEILATTALRVLLGKGLGKGKEDDGIVEAVLLHNAEDILEWILHLAYNWVIDKDPDHSCELDRICLPRKLINIIPRILLKMTKNQDLRQRIKSAGTSGTLLSRLLILYAQQKRRMMLLCTINILNTLWTSCGHGQPWETAFFQHMNLNPLVFAVTVVSMIQGYSIPLSNDLDYEDALVVLRLLAHIFERAGGTDVLVHTCLEQKGITLALTTIIGRVTDLLSKHKNIERKAQDTVYSAIAFSADILRRMFSLGGPFFLSMSVAGGLLGSCLDLCQFVDCSGTSSEVFADLNDSFATLLDVVAPLVIYHYNFLCTAIFVEDFKSRDAIGGLLGSSLPQLYHALARLKDRMEEEVSLVGNYIACMHSATSNYSSLAKYCDNDKCSSGKVTTLGRCSACHAGYYCSRRCQKAVWKEHREECKNIMADRTMNLKEPGLSCAFTMHDHQYLRRTVVPRFQFYAKELMWTPEHITQNSVISLDLTKSSFNMRIDEIPETTTRLPVDDSEESTTDAVELKVKYPTCERRNRSITISSSLSRTEIMSWLDEESFHYCPLPGSQCLVCDGE